jgi:hypothetical protein
MNIPNLKRSLMIGLVIVVVVSCIVLVARYVGLASVRGKVLATYPVKETHLVLIQGPQAKALAMLVTPGIDLKPEEPNSLEWSTADNKGEFHFNRVKWGKASIVGLTEIYDGRVCRTTQINLSIKIGVYGVELQAPEPGLPIWWERKK